MDQNLINRGVLGEKEVVDEIAQLIELGQARLVELVEKLGESLTKDDPKTRSAATGLLANVLIKLSKSRLQKQQVQVVTGFLCDRLDDQSSLKQVCDGIYAVIDMEQFSVTNVEIVLDSLKEVEMRRFSQNIRHSVYKVFELLINKFTEKCIKMRQKVIELYIQLTRNEKDPRNLLTSFGINYVILSQFDIKEYVDQLFDVTFCYFPITFEPPKDDPYGITAQDLKQALRKCISANGLFAKDSFEGLVEKLNSSVESVKKDTLETILACIENYDEEYVKEEWQEIWDGVKYEILHGSDDSNSDDIRLSIMIIKELGSISNLIDPVKKETEEKIDDPSGKMCLPAAKLITAVAQSSSNSFNELVEFSIPGLLIKFEDSPTIATQRTILEVFILFLSASENFDFTKYKDQIIASLAKALMGSSKNEVSLRKIGIRGFEMICELSNFASNEEIGMIVQNLNDTVLQDDNDELCNTSLVALGKIAEKYPNIIINISIPAFLNELPDDSSKAEKAVTDKQSKSKDYILSALATFSITEPVFNSLQVELLNRLESSSGSGDFALAIVSTLLAIIQKLSAGDSVVIKQYINTIVVPLMNIIIRAAKGNKSAALQHGAVVDAAGSVIELVVRALGDDEQGVWATKVTDALVECNNSDSGIIEYNVFEKNNGGSNVAQLLTSALAPLSTKVPVSGDRLVKNATNVLNDCTDVFTRGAYLRLIAVCANKKWVSSDFKLDVEVANDESCGANELEIAAYYAKGLILRNETEGFNISASILSLLNTPKGSMAAKVFGVLVVDDPLLSKNNRAVIRLLSKQRLFASSLPILVQKSDINQQQNNLTALASLLRYTPSRIIIPELETFLPLLLEAITLPNPRVQEAAIDTVYATLVESADVLAQRVDTIIPKLLTAKNAKKVNVRSAALRCLGALPDTLPRHVIQPYRQRVIDELQTSVDDSKRDVRREAVVCRQTYYEF